MPTYKFEYFDVRGRGELCRYVLHAAGRDFEDVRIQLQGDEWPKIKSETPFCQLPVLTVDGKTLGQSNCIARFLAREFGLIGKDSWQQALCDQYVELIEDMFKEVVNTFFEKDENKKKEVMKTLAEVVYPKFMKIFESALEKNGGKYLIGNSLTIADLAVYSGFETPVNRNPNLMNGYPKLKAQRAMVESIPTIQEYLKHRQPTDI